MSDPETDRLPERQRNALLRRVDWRFLLRQTHRPGALSLSSGRLAQAVSLVSEPVAVGNADLVVLGRPTRAAIRLAHNALRPGGELHCQWPAPRPAGVAMAHRALRRAGFTDIRVHWPGPRTGRAAPEFWLPLDSATAVEELLNQRPPLSLGQAALRRVWRAAAGVGSLAPLSVLARRPCENQAEAAVDELGAVLTAHTSARTDGEASGSSWLLLTGGKRSINKVAAVPFTDAGTRPELVIKFARVTGAEPALRREAQILATLARERPSVRGVPRLLGSGHRAGQLGIVETALPGSSLMSLLTPAAFPALAKEVTRWLTGLVSLGEAQPRSEWWSRLVQAPLDEFARGFARVLPPGMIAQVRERLMGLPDLRTAIEHRDCSPWNIRLTAEGRAALLDWESAEFHGLAGLDLVYFLANSAFVMHGAFERERTGETYASLLDQTTPLGAVAAQCVSYYCGHSGLDPGTLADLRLLCWIIHARSDFHHLALEGAAGPTDRALRSSVYLGLVQQELRYGNRHG